MTRGLDFTTADGHLSEVLAHTNAESDEMSRVGIVLGAGLLLAGCAEGRFEPFGGIADPVCMPDGSVAFYQEAANDGTLGHPRAKKEYCAWNKPATP